MASPLRALLRGVALDPLVRALLRGPEIAAPTCADEVFRRARALRSDGSAAELVRAWELIARLLDLALLPDPEPCPEPVRELRETGRARFAGLQTPALIGTGSQGPQGIVQQGFVPWVAPRLDAESSGRRPPGIPFTLEELDLLGQALDEGTPAALRARLHDLRWCAKRDPDSALLAVRAYLDCTLESAGEDPLASAYGQGCLLRAAQIFVRAAEAPPSGTPRPTLGSPPASMPASIEDLREELELRTPRAVGAARRRGEPLLVLRALRTCELLHGSNRESLASLAIDVAEASAARARFHWARALYFQAERMMRQLGRTEDAETIEMVRVLTLLDEARFRDALGGPKWVGASLLLAALDQLGSARDSAATVDVIRRELETEYLPGCPEAVRSLVQPALAAGLDLVLRSAERLEAAVRLRFLAALPIESLPLASPSQVCDGGFAQVFLARGAGATLWTAGAERAPSAARGPASLDPARWCALASAIAATYVEELRGMLAEEGSALRLAVAELTTRSTLVGAERGRIVERGLSACLRGDSIEGLSLLVPQLSFALRDDIEPRSAALASGGAAGVARPPAAPGELPPLPMDLRAAAAAILREPQGLDLSRRLTEGWLAAADYTRATSNLVLWLALRVLYLRHPSIAFRSG